MPSCPSVTITRPPAANPADEAAAAKLALRAALAQATAFDEYVVIEEAVDARELEVGVIGNEAPRASVVGEIVPTHDFYDYEDKYVDGASQMVIPADVPANLRMVARALRDVGVDERQRQRTRRASLAGRRAPRARQRQHDRRLPGR